MLKNCLKCRGDGKVTGVGYSRIECVKCYGTGIEVDITNSDIEPIVRKPGRPMRIKHDDQAKA